MDFDADQLASSPMSDDFRDGAESGRLSSAPKVKRFSVVGVFSVLVVILLISVVVWSNGFRRKSPDWEAILRVQELGDFEGSIDLCVQLAELDRGQAAESLAFAGETAMSQLAQFSRGEELMLSALEHDSTNRRALGSYSRLLTISGQRWKSTRWLAEYVVRFDDSLQQLIWLSDASVVITDWNLLKTAQQAFPNDPLPSLGMAFDALVDRPKDAVRELQACLRISPGMLEANALLGRALLDSGDKEAYQDWDRGLSADFEIHPEVWRARGMWWKDRDFGKALRCYLECCRRAPDDAETNLQISLLLIQVGETEAAAVFRNRFEMIVAYLDLVRAARERNDLSVASDAAALAEQLQRPAESIGWRRVAAQQSGLASGKASSDWAAGVDLASAVASTFDPDEIVDRSHWPIPGPAEISRDSGSVVQQSLGTLRFRNVADAIGLLSRATEDSRQLKLLESLHVVNGGGIAILDYDSDSWPDLFLPQGVHNSVLADTKFSDRLFRNVDGFRAQNVSAHALTVDWEFGQGCAIGDFNADGFPDILVASIGGNSLFQNCGDGTFETVTRAAGLAGEAWTSSCAFADLNSDSLPDVYEVRYVETDGLFEKECYATDSVRRPCPPKEFRAAGDVIWINAGDGSFVALQNAKVPVDAGRGLGLIIADFDQQPGLDVFVGNDGTADFLLINDQETAGSTAQFREEATLRGVGLNGKGRMQATMGIAYGDVDRDGVADLFQANFHREANTLYLGLGDGYFNDATARAGLYTTSLAMLGWGTGFLDADLDGWLDIVVMNGHLEDRTRFGEPFQMPAQIFHNVGQGQFTEVAAESAEAWFATPRLSRALATVDWDRDGRTDLAVTTLDSPAALLIGDTDPVGNYISIHLRGTISERDAIGAKVVLEVAGIRHVYQMTTGDGYQASNQRRIHVGLGEATTIDRLAVSWPSGIVQEWESLSVNQEIVIVEECDRPSWFFGDVGIRQ